MLWRGYQAGPHVVSWWVRSLPRGLVLKRRAGLIWGPGGLALKRRAGLNYPPGRAVLRRRTGWVWPFARAVLGRRTGLNFAGDAGFVAEAEDGDEGEDEEQEEQGGDIQEYGHGSSVA